MASHEELLIEMPKLEKLSNAQRLKHAKKRRQKQLKKWQDTERIYRQSQISISEGTIGRASRKSAIKFDEDARLRDAINRNDADEGIVMWHILTQFTFSTIQLGIIWRVALIRILATLTASRRYIW